MRSVVARVSADSGLNAMFERILFQTSACMWLLETVDSLAATPPAQGGKRAAASKRADFMPLSGEPCSQPTANRACTNDCNLHGISPHPAHLNRMACLR